MKTRTKGLVTGCCLIVAAAFMLAAPAPVRAQHRTPAVNRMQRRQERRIRRSVKSGQLTARQGRRLQRGQARLQRRKEAAKDRGALTPRERTRLRRETMRQNRRIRRVKRGNGHSH